jgi:hypothetical protein
LGTDNGNFLFFLGANGIVNKKTSPYRGVDLRVSKEYRAKAFSEERFLHDYALVKLEKRV